MKLLTNSRLASTKLYECQCQNILQNEFPNLTKHLGHTMKIVNFTADEMTELSTTTRWLIKQALALSASWLLFTRNSLTLREMIYRCLTKLFTSYQKVQFFEKGLNDNNLDES